MFYVFVILQAVLAASCPADEFQCALGGCIDAAYVCDRYTDCPGGTDEEWCLLIQQTPHKCPSSMFACNSSDFCLTEKWVCDDIMDCMDGSDEDAMLCNPLCDQDDMFVCHSDPKECVPFQWMCDGINDCTDNSDELYCSES